MEPSSTTCQKCHQIILPTYYFCPNCGTLINQPPLATTFSAQFWIYFLSIILPAFCYIFIAKWKGLQYLQSKDQQTKTIGLIACALLILSTVFTFWFAYTFTQKTLQTIMQTTLDGEQY